MRDCRMLVSWRSRQGWYGSHNLFGGRSLFKSGEEFFSTTMIVGCSIIVCQPADSDSARPIFDLDPDTVLSPFGQ